MGVPLPGFAVIDLISELEVPVAVSGFAITQQCGLVGLMAHLLYICGFSSIGFQ